LASVWVAQFDWEVLILPSVDHCDVDTKMISQIPNHWEFVKSFSYIRVILMCVRMKELKNTVDNISVIQSFLDETRKRIFDGVEIVFTNKASSEFEDLALEYGIEIDDIESAIVNLSTENYFRGIDPSGNSDFNVCAFSTLIGKENIQIYLKYGLEVNGLEILLFSNHIPKYPMKQPFKN
jgi:hypothetical protein